MQNMHFTFINIYLILRKRFFQDYSKCVPTHRIHIILFVILHFATKAEYLVDLFIRSFSLVRASPVFAPFENHETNRRRQLILSKASVDPNRGCAKY